MTIKPIAMRDALLERIWQEMARDEDIFFVTADFGSPVLDKIRADFAARFVNVGIAEQNLINVSAGLALEGYKVFAYAIAPFITMRCYEQIRVSLALLSEVRPMNVSLIGVGAGYSYVVSGPTHQCYEDLTLMRALANMQVFSPADHICSGALLERCLNVPGPKYLRLDAQVLPVIYENGSPDMASGLHVHASGGRVVLVATGYMLHTAKLVLAELGEPAGLIDLFDLARFDAEALRAALAPYEAVVTLEEGFSARGGMDALIAEFLRQQNLRAKLLNIGVDPGYRFELGSRLELHEQVGIGPHVALHRIQAFLGAQTLSKSPELTSETL
jgi:transketolase